MQDGSRFESPDDILKCAHLPEFNLLSPVGLLTALYKMVKPLGCREFFRRLINMTANVL